MFLNHYRCPNDGATWTDQWECKCNDRCPECRAEIEPERSEAMTHATGWAVFGPDGKISRAWPVDLDDPIELHRSDTDTGYTCAEVIITKKNSAMPEPAVELVNAAKDECEADERDVKACIDRIDAHLTARSTT